jgi:hypothetical protein
MHLPRLAPAVWRYAGLGSQAVDPAGEGERSGSSSSHTIVAGLSGLLQRLNGMFLLALRAADLQALSFNTNRGVAVKSCGCSQTGD